MCIFCDFEEYWGWGLGERKFYLWFDDFIIEYIVLLLILVGFHALHAFAELQYICNSPCLPMPTRYLLISPGFCPLYPNFTLKTKLRPSYINFAFTVSISLIIASLSFFEFLSIQNSAQIVEKTIKIKNATSIIPNYLLFEFCFNSE